MFQYTSIALDAILDTPRMKDSITGEFLTRKNYEAPFEIENAAELVLLENLDSNKLKGYRGIR
jgi:hypothetical protein